MSSNDDVIELSQQNEQDSHQNVPNFSTPYRDFEELVVRVRNDDPRLLDHPLEPDSYFQTRHTTLADITDVVVNLNRQILNGRSAEDLPTIIIAWGKCRVGSTAMTNLFGIAGIQAYYNPIKTAIRQFLLEGPAKGWNIPQRSQHQYIFAKEMSGPYHLADCIVNPLQILIEAGYPAEKIELIAMDRDPYRALHSWLRVWGHLIPPPRLVQHYILSALNAIRIKKYALDNGVRVSNYVYEASRIPAVTIQKLFRRLNIEQYFHSDVFNNWNEKGDLASKNSRIVFPEIPERLRKIPMHASETQYQYQERSTDQISGEFKTLIDLSGVAERYQEAARAFIEELQIGPEEEKTIFSSTSLNQIPRGMDRRHAR